MRFSSGKPGIFKTRKIMEKQHKRNKSDERTINPRKYLFLFSISFMIPNIFEVE